MSEKNFPNDWSVRGRVMINGVQGDPEGDLITIPETPDRCIPSMANSTGIPINAELATSFINNFNTKFSVLQQPPPAADPLIEFSLDKKYEALNAHHNDTLGLLTTVVDLSHGMTFDRDLILKILSQTGCEGVRLYLCARQDDIDQPAKFDVSLVMVGVDGEGCDHRFNLDKIKASALKDGAEGDPTITDDSLIGEYSTPPSGSTPFTAQEVDKKFVLYKIAKDLKPIIAR